MTGPEHFSEAERLLEAARAGGELAKEPGVTYLPGQTLQAAQVHATLALAAAITAPGELFSVQLEGGAS